MSSKYNINIPSNIATYTLTEVLGHGGMGIVSKAVCSTDGKEVAIKVLHTPQIGIFGLLREIHAIQELNHPGIVRLLDRGNQDGLVWYAMEYLDARPLRGFIPSALLESQKTVIRQEEKSLEDTWNMHISGSQTRSMNESLVMDDTWAQLYQQRFDIAKSTIRAHRQKFGQQSITLLKYAAQVACTLDYLHSKGLVHCDIKPDNILITNDGRAILIDFGLVVNQRLQANEGELSEAGLVFGTAIYLSPERLLRKPFDARADLYALGCMMYQMIVGLPPIFYPETERILGDITVRNIPRPSFYVDDIPPELDDVIVRLVAEEPSDRPGYARHVLYILKVLGIAEESQYDPNHKGYLYRAPYIGRDHLMRRLEGDLRRSVSEHGSATLIQGESGIGKTSLASYLLQYARKNHILCFVGRASVVRKGETPSESVVLSLFADIFRNIVDILLKNKQKSFDDFFHENTKALLPAFPFLRVLPEIGDDLHMEGLSQKDMQQRMLEEVIWTLERVSKERPLCMVFDNIHWADPLSIQCIHLLLNRTSRKKWFVLLLGNNHMPFDTSLKEREDLKKENLYPLDEAFHESFIRETLGGAQFPVELLHYVRKQTKGNPLFIHLCIQDALDEGYLYLSEQGNWRFEWRLTDLMSSTAPQSIAQVLSHSIDSFNPQERALCVALAVFGQPTEIELLEQVMSTDAAVIFDIAKGLYRKSICCNPRDESSCLIDFLHWGIEEILVEKVDKEKIKELHLKVVRLLESHPLYREDKARLARHYERADKIVEARERYVQAAEEAIKANTNARATILFDKALALYGEERDVNPVRYTFVEKVLVPRGFYEKAMVLLSQLIEQTATYDEHLMMRGQYIHALVLMHQGEYTQAEQKRQQCLEYFQKIHENESVYECMFLQAVILLEKKDDAGLQILQEIKEQTDKNYTKIYELASTNIILGYLDYGRYKEALSEIEHYTNRTGDSIKKGRELLLMNHKALIYMYLGTLDTALECAQEARRKAKKYGFKGLEINILGNMGLIYMQREEFQKSIRVSKEVQLLAMDMGFRGVENVAMINILLCQIELAQYIRAQRCIDTLQERREELDPYLYSYILFAKARKLRYQHQSQQSVEHIEKALEICKKHRMNQPYALFLCEYGHVLLSLSRSIQVVENLVQEAQSWVKKLEVSTESELGVAVYRIKRALEWHALGKELTLGSRKEDLPKPVLMDKEG